MLTRRFKNVFKGAKEKASGLVDSAVEVGKSVKDKADEMMEVNLTFDEAKEQLLNDLEKKGLRVFDYLDLDEDVVKSIKAEITSVAVDQLSVYKE